MTGRRLWFVGIGGAGLSAYAQLARARGAQVGGWDRVRTSYLEALGEVEVEISPAGERLRFSVRDEGLGVPPAEHRRIFALRRLCADPGLPLRRARLAACAKSG